MHFNYFIALYLNLDDIVHYGIIVIVSQFHLTIIQKKWGPKIFPLRFVTKQICSNGCHQLNNQCCNNQSGKLPSHASLFFSSDSLLRLSNFAFNILKKKMDCLLFQCFNIENCWRHFFYKSVSVWLVMIGHLHSTWSKRGLDINSLLS